MKRTTCFAMFVMFCPAAFAATPPCPEPGKIIYPMDEVLVGEARVLEVAGSMKIEAVPETFDVSLSPDRLRQEVFAALEGKSEAEQDALLLARFAVYAGFNNAAVIFTALREAGLLETYLDLLDRRELSEAANALRAAGSQAIQRSAALCGLWKAVPAFCWHSRAGRVRLPSRQGCLSSAGPLRIWTRQRFIRLTARLLTPRLARSGVAKVDLQGQRGTTLVSCDELTAMAAVIALHVPLSGEPAPETSSHRRETS